MARRWGWRRSYGLSAALCLCALLPACGGQSVELAAVGSNSPVATPSSALRPAASAAPSFQPAFPGQPAPSAAAVTGPVCPVSGINVVPEQQDGAMDLSTVTLRAENCGPRTLTLEGYPALRVLDENGVVQPVALHKGVIKRGFGDDAKPVAILLEPGQSAMAVLGWSNLTLDGPHITGTYLRIVPAPHQAPQTVAQDVDLGSTARISVTAWQRYKK